MKKQIFCEKVEFVGEKKASFKTATQPKFFQKIKTAIFL